MRRRSRSRWSYPRSGWGQRSRLRRAFREDGKFSTASESGRAQGHPERKDIEIGDACHAQSCRTPARTAARRRPGRELSPQGRSSGAAQTCARRMCVATSSRASPRWARCLRSRSRRPGLRRSTSLSSGPSTRSRSVGSTVPANGDENPYGIVNVTKSAGSLVAGDILISNFNNSGNLQGTGTTIVELAPERPPVAVRADQPSGAPRALPGRCRPDDGARDPAAGPASWSGACPRATARRPPPNPAA